MVDDNVFLHNYVIMREIHYVQWCIIGSVTSLLLMSACQSFGWLVIRHKEKRIDLSYFFMSVGLT